MTKSNQNMTYDHSCAYVPRLDRGIHQTLITILLAVLFFMIRPTYAASFETQEWQTTNGAQVVFHRATEVPMLDINIAFAAGSAYDGEKFGLSALTTDLLDQGNGELSAGDLAHKFADIGAQYGGASSQDMMLLTLRTLTQPDALKQATDMFALLIAHPNFPVTAFLREKNQQLMSIQQSKESADTIAKEAFYQSLYGEHPYAHPIEGNDKSVEALTIEDVHHFYQHYVVGHNAVIVMVGDIDSRTAHALAERLMQDLPKGQAAPPIPLASRLKNPLTLQIQHPASQTALKLGQLGITHQNKDYYPLQVGNYILGGSINSRLAQELREKRGLTYDVNSSFSAMPGIGPFMISFSTKHHETKTALEVARKTLTTFVETGPDESELIAAKQYLTGSFPVSLAKNRSIANMLLRLSFYHLPKDFLNSYVTHINAVTVADIKQAFQHQIDLNQLTQITVGRS